MENVTDQPPEGEPEIRHYTEAGDPRTWCGVSLADVTVGELTRDRGATTCPGCTSVLVDAHLFDDDRRAPACPHGYDAEDACEGCTPPSAAEPERRTVALEVLTDELRALSDDVLYGANVGVVLRVDGEAVAVPELDAEWASRHRQPADVLAALLRQARFHADEHDGIRPGGAELLMPTADVLAVLDGHADARLLTAPVHVLALDINEGMFLVGPAGGDGEELREVSSPSLGCTLPDCENGAVCVVLVVGGVELHRNGYERVLVRVPASVTR